MRNRLARLIVRIERLAQRQLEGRRSWIQTQRFAELRDRLGALTGIGKLHADSIVGERRVRIDLERASEPRHRAGDVA